MNTVSTPDISIYGNKYFLTILDDYARYSWVFFIKKKKKWSIKEVLKYGIIK